MKGFFGGRIYSHQLPAPTQSFYALKAKHISLCLPAGLDRENKMNKTNLAITVSPNIFRRRNYTGKDMLEQATHYELLTRMIDLMEVYFDKTITLEELIKHPTNLIDLQSLVVEEEK